MKTKKKRTLKLFGIIDVVAIEEYLENMAAEGWIFNGCSGIFYTFIKGEPQHLKYHVSLFHDGSAFGSNGDNIETRQYAAEWEAQGWRFIYANGRQVFFVSEDLQVEPIKLEPEEHLKKIKKCINGELIMWPLWVLICLTNLLTLNNSWPTEFMETGSTDLCWVVLLVFWTGHALRILHFYIKNKKRVSKGEDVIFPEGKKAVIYNKVMSILLVATLVLLFIELLSGDVEVTVAVLISLVIISVIVYFGIKLTRSIGSRKTKAQQIIIVVGIAVLACVVTIVVATTATIFDVGGNNVTIEYSDEGGLGTVKEKVQRDEIPLTVEDLGFDVSGLIQADTYCEKYMTIYGTVSDCWQAYYDQYGGPAYGIYYTIADCRFGWVKDKLIEQYMTNDYYGEDTEFIKADDEETKKWGAEQVYILTDGYDEGHRLVVYEDVVFFIENDIEFTDDIINRIATKLAEQLD